MDNGLDIAQRRCVFAFHASAADSPAKLARFAQNVALNRGVCGSAPALEQALERSARAMGCALDWSAADRAMTWSEEPRHRLFTMFDPDYPRLLREIAHPPLALFVAGDAAVLNDPQIAIVGSRKASHYGRECAHAIAQDLARGGFVVTSGMALGIDAAAHRGALAAERATIAVFGCGIDRIYPRRHRQLAEAIVERGAIVSEFPWNAPPRPYHFPRRNRIISGLSVGTLVVEAAVRSGSITTALHALEQSRDVFALPGSVRNPLARGCHSLIQQGAMLVNEADEIMAEFPAVTARRQVEAGVGTDPDGIENASSESERGVLEACAYEAASFDEIVRRSGLTATEVSSILSALEVRGAVRSLAGNRYVNTVDQA